jgi:hypothetical protein
MKRVTIACVGLFGLCIASGVLDITKLAVEATFVRDWRRVRH